MATATKSRTRTRTKSGRREIDPRPEAGETIKKIYQRYVDGMEVLNKPYIFFNDMSPIQYWAEGRRRFNVYVPPRDENSEEWKTIYKSMLTRNKCLSVIAHAVSMMMSPSITAQNDNQDEDIQIAQFFKDTVEYTQEKEGFDVKLFWAMVTAVAEGSVNMMDCYGKFEREGKKITSYDGTLSSLKWESGTIEDFEGAYTLQVANDELLVPNPLIQDLQEEDWVIVRKRMTKDNARRFWGDLQGFEKVPIGGSKNWNWVADAFEQFDSFAHLAETELEVILHWEKNGDHFDVAINGELLTPEGCPNPRHDKMYPISRTGYEPIDPNFFWYKSLTDKLAQEQDVFDVMMRMFIDRQHLRNIPALLTSNQALVNENIIVPGLVTYKGDEKQTVETISGVSEGTDQGTVNLLQTMMTQASESSSDPMASGNKGQGSQTATQTLQMAQNAQIMFGLFGWMIGKMITDWTKLRIDTIIWQLSSREDWSKITLNDRVISNGRIGKRTYLMERGLAKRSDPEKMDISKEIAKTERMLGGKVEIVAIDPEEASKTSLYIKLDAQPRPKRTDALMQAVAMEKWNTYSATPEVFNVNAAGVKLAQAWGDDPNEMVLERSTQADPMQAAMQQAAGGGKGAAPTMEAISGGLKQKMGMPTGQPAQAQAA